MSEEGYRSVYMAASGRASPSSAGRGYGIHSFELLAVTLFGFTLAKGLQMSGQALDTSSSSQALYTPTAQPMTAISQPPRLLQPMASPVHRVRPLRSPQAAQWRRSPPSTVPRVHSSLIPEHQEELVPPNTVPPVLGLFLGFLWQPVKRGISRWSRAASVSRDSPESRSLNTAVICGIKGVLDVEQRHDLLQRLAESRAMGPDVALDEVAVWTEDFDEQDLESLVNSAAISAARQSKTFVQMEDLREALAARASPDTSYAFAYSMASSDPDKGEASKTALNVAMLPMSGEPTTLRRRLAQREAYRASKTLVFETLRRVALPALLATIMGCLYFDNVSQMLANSLDPEALRVLGRDESQFMQNFQTVIGLLFSILAGNAYSSLYAQQENIFFALFQEVSEAKSLLEQVTLVCQGRCSPCRPNRISSSVPLPGTQMGT